MRLSARSARAPATSLDALLVMLSVSGLAFWFVVGLPWGPHNESFAWVVRLEQRSLWEALFQKFPSVLSLRPLGQADHDRFGLAVLIFHLLMMGRHPFSGVYLDKGDMPLEKAIREGRFAPRASNSRGEAPGPAVAISACPSARAC